MDQRLKDKRDAQRFRAAVAKGLDLGKVLEVVFGGREEALSGKTVGAAAAFKRLERAVRAGQVGAKVKGKKHLALSLLKGLTAPPGEPGGPICGNSDPEPAAHRARGCRGAVDPGRCRARSPR